MPKGGLTGLSGQEHQAQAQTIVTWLNAKVANHKKLRGGVRFVPEIPKNASGKILRRIMKECAKAEAETAGVQGPRVRLSMREREKTGI
jgi:acyl-coenzyme A synthetase/AMP-(fatty) acid ligase